MTTANAKEGDILHNPSTGEMIILRGNRWVPYEEEVPKQPPANNLDVSYGESAARGAAQGLTFGFADEISGAVESAFTDKTYEQARDESRAAFNRAQQANPMTYGGAELLSGLAVPGAGALGVGAKLASKVPGASRLATNMVGAGASSGVYGLGASDAETPEGLLTDTGVAAGAGAVLGPTLGYAGQKTVQGAGAVGRLLQDTFTNNDRAANSVVRKALENSGITNPQMARQALNEQGPMGVLADVGENPRALGELVGKSPGPGRESARQVLNTRQEGQQGRLTQAAQDTLSPKWTSYTKYTDDVAAARKEQAGPLYDKAYEVQIQPTPDLVRFSQTGFGREILEETIKRMGNSYKARDSRGLVTPGGGISSRFAHELLRVMRDRVNSTFDAKQGNLGNDYNDWFKALRNDIYEQNQFLKEANGVYAGAKELEEAATAGRAAMRGNTQTSDDIERVMRDMTEGEMDSFRIGLFQGVIDRVESAATRTDATKKLDQSERLVKVMRQAFNDDKAFERFWRTVDREMNMAATRSQVVGGSRTQGLLAEEGGAATAAVDIARYGVMEGVAKFIEEVTRKKLPPEDYDKVSKLLFGNLSDQQLARIFGRSRFNDAVSSPAFSTVLGGSAAATSIPDIQSTGLLSEGR